jgi:hypothetical protein
MVEFHRDHPEYEFKDAKYVLYMMLFEGVTDQRARIVPVIYSGWATEDSDGKVIGGPRGGEIDYFLDDELALNVNEVRVTIIHDGVETTYDSINNPDVIRLAEMDALGMGLEEFVVRDSNGVPDLASTPIFFTVKCMFNSFPADTVDYRIEVTDLYDEVVRSESGTINIIDPPWVAS